MEDHDYVMAEKGGQMEIDPMSHQLKTTCNFGTKIQVTDLVQRRTQPPN